MAAPRARRWLAIGIVATCAACSSDAVAPHRIAAPVASPSPVVAPPSAAEPIVGSSPSAAPIVEPPAAVEPIAALPPCPKDPERDEHQKPDHVVQLVGLSPSMTVVDLGSGSGYFLCRLSRAVGPHGRVVATEVDKGLVRELTRRAEREQLSNVRVILAPTSDVGIAAASADRILLVNVWHHIADRKRYAARVARSLAPGGKVVVVDFKPAGPSSGHGVLPERVLAELVAGGIDGTLVSEDLPEQYVIIGSVRASANDARQP